MSSPTNSPKSKKLETSKKRQSSLLFANHENNLERVSLIGNNGESGFDSSNNKIKIKINSKYVKEICKKLGYEHSDLIKK